MIQIENIRIKNFRGFSDLEINNFNQVNIFIGKNNSGKSTVLESLFLLTGMSNPILIDNANRLRGLTVKEGEEFKYYFHNLNTKNSPEFSFTNSTGIKRNLKLTPEFDSLSSLNRINNDILEASQISPRIKGLTLDFSSKEPHSKEQKGKSKIFFENNVLKQEPDKKYKEKLRGVFITGGIRDVNPLSRYAQILKKKNDKIILEMVKLIDPKIESIQALPDGLYFSYKNIEELVPLSISGDGVKRYLDIIITIAEKKNSIVLIDEIETGLHYTAHKDLWKNIFSLSHKFSTQLFISTHNYDTLKCINELLEEEDFIAHQNKINIYNISKTLDTTKAYKYSFESLNDAMNNNVEIR